MWSYRKVAQLHPLSGKLLGDPRGSPPAGLRRYRNAFRFRTTNGDFPPARAVRGSRGKRAEAQERAFPCQSGGEKGKEVACAGQAATWRISQGPSFVSSVAVLSRTAAQAVGMKICPRPSFARHAALLGGLQGRPLTSRAASAKQRKQQARELGLCPSPRQTSPHLLSDSSPLPLRPSSAKPGGSIKPHALR